MNGTVGLLGLCDSKLRLKEEYVRVISDFCPLFFFFVVIFAGCGLVGWMAGIWQVGGGSRCHSGGGHVRTKTRKEKITVGEIEPVMMNVFF